MQTVDENQLETLLDRMLGDVAAAASGALVLLGDRLGLYRAIAEHGPVTSQELADHTGLAERYVREWLANQAAGGYVEYDPPTERFSMTPEQVATLVDENSPAYLHGNYDLIAGLYRDEPRVREAFRTGGGVAWGDHDACLFCGVERVFRTAYRADLVQNWIPALEGVREKLKRGALVADVGCGHGASTLILAEAFPNSTFVGYDFHDASIECARERARDAGLANVRFEVASAKDYPGEYDLVAFFDCLHDMGDPVGAARHVRTTLRPGGTWMIVEPAAGDRLEENLTPIGRLNYACSTMGCVPTSLAQEVGLALGAQAGRAKLTEVVQAGGFSRCRVAAETPFNLVLEARV